MQYMLTTGTTSRSSQLVRGRSATRGSETRQQDKIQRGCAAEGGSIGDTYWGTFTPKEVVPPLAILVTIILAVTSGGDATETARAARIVHSLPFTGTVASVRKSIEFVMPNQAQRYREGQQALITSAGLVTPVAVASLTSIGAVPTPKDEL